MSSQPQLQSQLKVEVNLPELTLSARGHCANQVEVKVSSKKVETQDHKLGAQTTLSEEVRLQGN
jgi:hypothetical protein